MRDLLQATGRVEARSDFPSERLIVNKAVRLRRANRLLVQAHSVEVAALYARDLRAHQRDAILEILRAMLRPDFELPMVSPQSLAMLRPLVGRGRSPGGRVGKGPIEVILCRFEYRARRPQQWLRLRCGHEGAGIIARKEARLQLSDLIPALGERECCVTGQMALELHFIKVFIVEGSELRRRTPKGADQAELRRDDVNREAKPRLLCKLESLLG